MVSSWILGATTSTYTSVTTTPTYLLYYEQTADNSWAVQYTTTTVSAEIPLTAPWQIVRAWWRPAAPAILRHGLSPQDGVTQREPGAPKTITGLVLNEISLVEFAGRDMERVRAERERRQQAAARARQLLLGELDPVQRAQFEAEGFFVHAGKRGRRYRIRRDSSANIDLLDREGRQIERLCVHPQGAWALPPEDTMLAQLLHLRDDERALLRIANRHPP